MDNPNGLLEDRFKALLGRAVKREDRERLSKLRGALRISPNDAVWDIMIALDYHLQLYNAVPRKSPGRPTRRWWSCVAGRCRQGTREACSRWGCRRRCRGRGDLAGNGCGSGSRRDRLRRTLHRGRLPDGRPGPAAMGSEWGCWGRSSVRRPAGSCSCCSCPRHLRGCGQSGRRAALAGSSGCGRWVGFAEWHR
jgi:hypothetical protein